MTKPKGERGKCFYCWEDTATGADHMQMTQTTPSTTVAVNLLSECEIRLIHAIAPHDVPMNLLVWAALLTKLLRRNVTAHDAGYLIKEYNARVREVYEHQ